MPNDAPCDQLNSLLKGDPTAENRNAVAAHIANCSICQRIIAEERATVDFRQAQTAVGGAWSVLDNTVAFEPTKVDRGTSGGDQQCGPRVPDFEVLTELGRGGMGVVYKARQVSLDRLVALKMIRSAALADASHLARFNTEAESLAQLQHPNIVQVFAIGKHDDMPYLAMEFVPGATLASAVETQTFSARDAASMVEKLARAMFSAHQRGVLHRDLKPANVLLAADGEPKITDFGLAKRVGSDSQLTVDQTVMGTPSYMPPEQALGHVAEIGPRSDVYSLGAILYELLTGRPPFRGSTPLETIQQVIHREPDSPRTFNPKIPRDLETICLKCLHKQPAQRFETAADLADDLRRFQRDEPIQARRIGIGGRAWRWCRRNPALSSATALACLAVVLGLAGVIWQSRVTSRVREEAQRQFQIDSSVKLGLIQDLMERVPEQELAQNERLQEAISTYTDWLDRQPAADATSAIYADALFRVAQIQRRIGKFDLAEEMYLKSRDVFQKLVASTASNPAHLQGLVETLNWLGENYREHGELDKAIATYEQAMEQQTKLAAISPEDPFYKAKSARLLYNRALARRELYESKSAEADLLQSKELLQQALTSRPQETEFRQGMARSRINLGIVLSETNRIKAADDEYLAAIDLLQELEQQFPRNVEYRFELAMLLMNRGNLLQSEKKAEALRNTDLQVAEDAYRASVAKLRSLASEYANVSRYRKGLANSLNGLGAVQLQLGNHEKAEQTWIEAIAELNALITKAPGVAEYYVQLAQTNNNIGFLHRQEIGSAKLTGYRQQAVQQQRKAVSLSPTNRLYTSKLRDYEISLARVLIDGRKHADAAKLAEQVAKDSAADSRQVYAAARAFAQCAVIAAQDSSLDAGRRTEVMKDYRTKTANLLAKCRQQGLAIKPEDFPGIE